MSKFARWLLIEMVIFAVVITGVVALVAVVIRPYMNAETSMPADGKLEIRQLDTGEIQVSWPKADRADYYVFRMYQLPNNGQLTYQNDAGELIFEVTVNKGTSVVIPGELYSGNLLLSVTSAVDYVIDSAVQVRYGDSALQKVVCIDPPAIAIDSIFINAETQLAYVQFKVSNGTHFTVRMKTEDGKWEDLKTIEGDFLSLTFGEEGELPLPAFQGQYDFKASVYFEKDGVTYYSTSEVEFSITRAELVRADIPLEYVEHEQGSMLNWQQKECDYYFVQQLDEVTGQWTTIQTIDGKEAPSYLLVGGEEEQEMILRVVAAYEKAVLDGEGQIVTEVRYRAVSNELAVTIPIYIPEEIPEDTPEELPENPEAGEEPGEDTDEQPESDGSDA